MKHLHPKAVWLFFWSFLFRSFFIILFISIWLGSLFVNLLTGEEGNLRPLIIYFLPSFFFLLAFFVLFIYFWAVWTYNNYKYQLTEDVVKIERGVIAKKYSSVPYERIQNVDIHRGIIARLLGLSDLQIQTAGYSGYSRRGIATEGRLPGLDPQIAEQLQEELITRAKGTKQGL